MCGVVSRPTDTIFSIKYGNSAPEISPLYGMHYDKKFPDLTAGVYTL